MRTVPRRHYEWAARPIVHQGVAHTSEYGRAAPNVDVAIVSYFNPTDFGGGAERIAWAEAELLAADRAVAFVCASPPAEAGAFRQYRLGGWTRALYQPLGRRRNLALLAAFHLLSLFNPVAFVEALTLFRKLRPRVVHTHNLVALSPAVWLAARMSGARVVHTHQDLWLLCERATMTDARGRLCNESQTVCRLCRALRPVKTAAMSPVQLEIFPSRWLGDRLGRGGEVVPNFAIAPPADVASAAWSGDVPTIAYLGSLVPHKLGALLDAFGLIRRRGIEIHLAVAGSGPLAAEVRDLARSEPAIDFLGEVDVDGRNRLLARASAVVIPSTCPETSPLVFFEALAAGLPVIASDIGGMTELVRYENVVLVPPGDGGALADAIVTVLGDRAQRVELRAGAERHAAEASAARYAKQLLPLLGRS